MAIGITLSAVGLCPSVCDAVHCGSYGWCTGLKVVPASQRAPSRHIPTCPFRYLL